MICNCEYIGHFTDGGNGPSRQGKPQASDAGHDYCAEIADGQAYAAQHVGGVCRACAEGHLNEFLTPAGREALTLGYPDATAGNFPERGDYPADDNDGYLAFADAVKEWERTHVHRAADGTPISAGARFWDNNLRVVEVTRVGGDSRPYSDTGEISTWHQTTGGSSDTLTGRMRQFGRLTRYFEGKDAEDYAPGTNYRETKG